MDYEIFEISGEKKTYDNILSLINNTNENSFIIESEYGSGKTIVLNAISDYLKKNKIKNFKIYHDEYSLCQEYNAILNFLNHYKCLDLSKIEFSLDGIPYVGSILDYFSKKFLTDKRHVTSIIEQTILISLDNLCKNEKEVFLLCEDIDKWDIFSRSFINKLIKKELDLKSINNIRIILTTNKKISLEGRQVSYLSSISIENIALICNRLNKQIILNYDEIDFINTISKGNLRLIIEALNLVSNYDFKKKSDDYYNMICNRIKKEKDNYLDILSLLQYLSVIGKKSPTKLLEEYFIYCGKKDFYYTIEDCINLRILENEKEIYTYFLNELIYIIIHRSTSGYIKTLNKNLIPPFKKLYPAQYKKVATYFYKSGMIEEANKNVLSAYLLYFIDNREIYLIDENEICRLSSNYQLYKKIINIYQLYYDGKYNDALYQLDTVFTVDIEWNYELDFLKAQILTNGENTLGYYKECYYLLEKWVFNDDFKQNNKERWIRATLHLIDIMYELDFKISLAKKLNHEVNMEMMYLAKFDEYYIFKISSLDMKANIYHKCEIANNKLMRSKNWFEKNKLRFPVQYYISLINYSGSCLIMGNYNEAYENALQALKFYTLFSNTKFLPKQEILINNFLISAFLAKKYPIDIIINDYVKSISNFKECADYILMQNNLVALYFFNKEYEKSYTLSKKLYEHVDSDLDTYHAYFIYNNYLFINYFLKNRIDKKAYQYIEKNVPLINDKAYFLKRNSLIKKSFSKKYNLSRIKIEISQNKFVGKAWKYWGNCFLFSELQTWSDC